MTHLCQMDKYWNLQPSARERSTTPSTPTNEVPSFKASIISNYDWYHQILLMAEENEGWASELWHSLKDMPVDVTKETDIVEWWQVCLFSLIKQIWSNMSNRITLSAIQCFSDHSWHPPLPSLICPLQVFVFLKQVSCWWLARMSGISKIWRTSADEVFVVK